MQSQAKGFNSYHSGQAQHLIDWEFQQLKKQGKIVYLPVTSADVKQMDKPLTGIKGFLFNTALIVLFFGVFCSLVGAVDKVIK